MKMFTIPDDSGITQLPFGEDHGLCANCEGRPAFVEVRRPADAPARRLCMQCFFEEVSAAQPAPTEILADEERRLAEAEASSPAAELGRMAEFLEEWWAEQEDRPPAFVSEFISRHLASAPPPAAPVFGVPVAQEDLQAARLALLSLRGATCERHEVASDQYLIEPDHSPVSRERAVELLARMPKPLACHARADGEIMRIRCRTISDPSHLEARAQDAEYWAGEGGQFPHLRLAYGDRYPEQLIFCLGCHESLVVPASDVERQRRDYELRPSGSSASPPSAYLATNPEAARAAIAAGAAYLMKCYFAADDRTAEEEGRVVELRDSLTWDHPVVYALTTGLGSACDACGERPATWLATDTRATPWRERRLCEVCTAGELAPHALEGAAQFERGVAELSEKGRRTMAEDLARAIEHMERWWKILPAPPEVIAAIERCRQL